MAAGGYDAQFPVDVFQTGSGTSTNMNANEVIARLAAQRLGRPVHANDEVNMGQSSNDVIPTAIHVSAALLWRESLLPSLQHLAGVLRNKEAQVGHIVKTGRTHLMDAMPVTFGQEIGAWRTQVEKGIERVTAVEARLLQLAQGGTAVGTGINAHPEFAARFCAELSRATQLPFRPNTSLFEGIATQDTAVELSGQLKTVAVSLMKIANDLRWMNSGPLAAWARSHCGLAAGAAASCRASQSGHSRSHRDGGGRSHGQRPHHFRGRAVRQFPAERDAAGDRLQIDREPAPAGECVARARRCRDCRLRRQRIATEGRAGAHPILVTALNPVIGYEKGAAIAKKAYAEGKPIIEVAAKNTDLPLARLQALLDPAELTLGGIKGGTSGRMMMAARNAVPDAAWNRLLSALPAASRNMTRNSSASAPAGRQHRSAPAQADPPVLRPAAVLIGLLHAAATPGILLTVRAGHLRQHAGQIAFPGGVIEAGDAGPARQHCAKHAKKWGWQPLTRR